jgi:hypothetical protein
MRGERLWRKILKIGALRDQRAICPVCHLPLSIRQTILIRGDNSRDFIPNNVWVIHPVCERAAQRLRSDKAFSQIKSVAAE